MENMQLSPALDRALAGLVDTLNELLKVELEKARVELEKARKRVAKRVVR